VESGPEGAKAMKEPTSDNRHLEEFETLQQVKEYFAGVLGRYQRDLTPLEECDNCFFRKQRGCQGVCIMHSIFVTGTSVRRSCCPNPPIRRQA
jgi:hypothetical protein